MPHNETVANLGLEEYKYDFREESKPVFKAQKGLSTDIVREISAHKGEPEWMLNFRLKALEIFYSKPMPTWGGDLSQLGATRDDIYYYLKPQEQMERSWDDVPDDIKRTFERHFPFSERAGFVDAENVHAAEVLDRCELLNDHFHSRHVDCTDGKIDADYCRK